MADNIYVDKGGHMRLETISRESIRSFDYMERIVNDGSKSGFTSIHITSNETNPLKSDGFDVKKLVLSPGKGTISSFGKLPDGCDMFENDNYTYIHPDWLLKSIHTSPRIEDVANIQDGIRVIPTSSSRTVRVDGAPLFIKLHYPGMLGRLDRTLKREHIVSSICISNIFKEAMSNGSLPSFFDYMPETYGRLFQYENLEIGLVLRMFSDSMSSKSIIPGFSLFSVDKRNQEDTVLLHQLLEVQKDPYKFLLDDLCFGLIDIFFQSAFSEGLIAEMHSQNIVFSFSSDWSLDRIILRDFESIDKDLSLRRELGKSTDFTEYPYKCIDNTDKNYKKRHSLMFDHKLCEYLIEPIIECASSYFLIHNDKINGIRTDGSLDCIIGIIRNDIKDYVNSKYSIYIHDFFPDDDCWYKYPDTEIDRSTNERPYTSMGKAKYR